MFVICIVMGRGFRTPLGQLRDQVANLLLRLQHGTYGVCEECDEPLSEARLRAIPFAILCRECQEDVEGREREERQLRLATETRTPVATFIRLAPWRTTCSPACPPLAATNR